MNSGSLYLYSSQTNLELLADKIIKERLGEEFYSLDFDKLFIDKICWSGFFPMASFVKNFQTDVLILKLHKFRCILKPKDVYITKTVRKESKKYYLTINKSFDFVLDKCISMHGDSWLRPSLVNAWLELRRSQEIIKSKFISFELRDCENRIVAGDLGFICNSYYSSLTGYTSVSGAGTVQLCSIAKLLSKLNFKIWDLGMLLKYKIDLGASLIPRSVYILEFREAREAAADIMDKDFSAYDLISS